jgi:RimJ/RimL family protein N-acetyltransferase
MRHDYRLEGFAFCLRPVRLEDAEFIVEVRTSDPERTRYLHPIARDVDRQREWLESYFDRENDYYWVVERRETARREGLISIYDIDPTERIGQWGRWVTRPNSLAAAESALLAYRAAFDVLNLESVYVLTVAENSRALSLQDRCGLRRVGVLKGKFHLAGRAHDLVKHVCDRKDWPEVRRRLEALALIVAQRLREPLGSESRPPRC